MKRFCPKANEACKLAPKCYSDKHHPDYPAFQYKTSLERQYREIRAIGNYMCRAEHDELHATQIAPEKPSVPNMVNYLANSAIYMEAQQIKQERRAA